MRVLVAEDDDGLRSVLERGLGEHGYVVDAVADGRRAVAFLRAYDYDVVVLDWRMPHLSGIDVLDEMRRRGIRTPTLLLTARDATADRVAGLDHGADDYLVKPFELVELLARLRALQRRPAQVSPPVLQCGDLTFDPAAFRAFRSGEPVALTTIELRLFELLMRRSPSVVSRRAIALHVWEDEADAVGSNTIDVHVGRLRSKLGGDGAHIETVRGLGYRMVET
ncbi:MAG: response regulator transcription factor [Actinomycetota bacterium]|nr:response regulator transcription factor [Actinomycetota bacterium]